jgi:hypothetical protein
MARLKVKQLSDYVSATNSLIAGAQVNVDASIDSLESEVSSNLALLSAELSGDVSALESADASLTTRISLEEVKSGSVDTVLSNALSTEISVTNSEIASADVRFGTIEGDVASAADAADLGSLETRVSNDESDLALVSTDVSAILAGAGANLDSFAEVISYLNSVDDANDLDLTNALSSIDTKISLNESRDLVLSAALSTEIDTTDAEVSSIDVVLGGLATASAFGSLETRVSNDESDLASAIASIDTRVADEEEQHSVDWEELSTAVSTEISTTNSEVTSIDARLSNEEDQHSSDYATLSTEVVDEVGSIDTRLSTADSGIASIDTALEGFAKEAYIHGAVSGIVTGQGGIIGIIDTAGNTGVVGNVTEGGVAATFDLNIAVEGNDINEFEANTVQFMINGLGVNHNAIRFADAQQFQLNYASLGYDLEATDVIEFRYIKD